METPEAPLRTTPVHIVQQGSLIVAALLTLGSMFLSWMWIVANATGWVGLLSVPMAVWAGLVVGMGCFSTSVLLTAAVQRMLWWRTGPVGEARPRVETEVERLLEELELEPPWTLSEADHRSWLARVTGEGRRTLWISLLVLGLGTAAAGLMGLTGALVVPPLQSSLAGLAALVSGGMMVWVGGTRMDSEEEWISHAMLRTLGGELTSDGVEDGAAVDPEDDSVTARGTLRVAGGHVCRCRFRGDKIELQLDLPSFPLGIHGAAAASSEVAEADVEIGDAEFDELVVVPAEDSSELAGAWLTGQMRQLLLELVAAEAVVEDGVVRVQIWGDDPTSLTDVTQLTQRMVGLRMLVDRHAALAPSERLETVIRSLPPSEATEMLEQWLSWDPPAAARWVADGLDRLPLHMLDAVTLRGTSAEHAEALARALDGEVPAQAGAVAASLATAGGRIQPRGLSREDLESWISASLDHPSTVSAAALERIAAHTGSRELAATCLAHASTHREAAASLRTRIRGGLALADDLGGGLTQATAQRSGGLSVADAPRVNPAPRETQ